MTLLKRNIAANFAGSLWQALMSLIFIPIYIRLMGIEAWGLIGIFATLQTIFGLLDVGLSSTLNREMARLSVVPDKAQEMRDLVRTLEGIYWGVAGVVGLVAVSSSWFIAHHWINEGQLSAGTVEQALLIMGVVMALQMPSGFYSGGLMGLQKQVLLNAINIVMSTLRGVGAVVVLWLVTPTIQAFFLWQLVVAAFNTFVFAVFLWRSLPRAGGTATFRRPLLAGIWRFTAGMSGIAVLATILTQLDKIILSRMLTLEMFGCYALASTVAMSLSRLFTPLFFSVYPRFTQLVSVDDRAGLAQLYHRSCQLMAVLILPVAAVVAFFSYELLLLWTRNQAMASASHRLVVVLICGTAINGLMNFPFALQLAFGWTKLSFYKNVVAVILVAPLIVYATAGYGAIGAAFVWLGLNLGLFVLEIPIMHRRLLRGERWRWYWQDVGVPLAACTLVAGACREFIRVPQPRVEMMLYLATVGLAALAATALATPVTRTWLAKRLAWTS
jgi:O-antigen/teichoic acid export membrane protein